MTSLLLLGRISEFDTEIETFTALAEKLRQPQSVWYSSLIRATRSYVDGRYEEARRLADQYLNRGQRVLDRNAVHSYMLQLVMSSIDVGGLEAFEATVKEMVRSFPRVVGWRAGLVLLLSELGRTQEATEQQQWLLRAGALSRPKRNEWFATMGGLAIASTNIRDQVASKKIYGQLLPYSDNLAVIGYCSFVWGPVQQLLGILASSLNEWSVAEAHFERSLTLATEIGARPCVARTQYDYARMLVDRGGQTIRANELLRSCSKIASDLGMTRLSSKAQMLITPNRA
jgi:tetratricopeptide (TPR) repeat protein